MIIQATVKRINRFGVATAYLLSIFAATLLVMPSQKASAELAALPEPTASTTTPSGSCHWMGEFHSSSNSTQEVSDTFQNLPYTYSLSSTHELNGVTAPVAGKTCGILWNGEYSVFVNKTQSAFCTFDPTDIMTETHTTIGAGSGTGELFTSFGSLSSTSPKWLNYNASASGGTLETSDMYTGCLESSSGESSTAWNPSFQPLCHQAGWSNLEGFYVNNTNVQASVGSCTYDLTTTFSPTNIMTQHQEVSWRLRKINCDTTVDSDGGGVGDCQEYEDRTNPQDASDDHNPISDAAQAVLNIAETTENQCLGQVAKLGTKDAAAGKGLKNVFEYWDLVGVPGITENSTFKEKMDAVRNYCKTN